MSEREEIVFDVRAEGTEQTLSDMRRLEQQFNKTMTAGHAILGLLRRMNLPEDVERTIDLLYRLAMAATMARTAIHALQTGTGVGRIMGIISLVETGIFAFELWNQMSRDMRT